jgi:hypothetical protein
MTRIGHQTPSGNEGARQVSWVSLTFRCDSIAGLRATRTVRRDLAVVQTSCPISVGMTHLVRDDLLAHFQPDESTIQVVAGLLALLTLFVVFRHGGCSAVPSGPPPGAPPFASGGTGFTVTCGGGPELLWLARAILLVPAAMVWMTLGLVLVQAITGRRLLPWHRQPLRPRLFVLGVALQATAVGLVAVALEVLVPPPTAAGLRLVTALGLLPVIYALLIAGTLIMWYAQPVSLLRRPSSYHMTRS